MKEMVNINNIKQSFYQGVWPAVGLMILGYLGYHLVSGERGLLAYGRLEARLTAAQSQYVALEAENNLWERRVRLLRADSLDLDLLEERAREVLSLARPHEYHVIWERESSP